MRLRQLINVSDLDPAWCWLAQACADQPHLQWRHCSSASFAWPRALPHASALRRACAAWQAAGAARTTSDGLVIAHGPSPALHAALALRARRSDWPLLAYAFTFTTLHDARRRALLARALRRVDRFVSFSTVEARLYPQVFDLDPARFEMQHWAVKPPCIDPVAAPPFAGPYISAIGSQGRDFRALLDALRELPALRLVIVAMPDCPGLDRLPPNATLLHGIPYARAMQVLQHGIATVIPLRDGSTPCGHGSLVAAMHLGQAIAATDSSALHDYLEHEHNGLSVEPDSAAAWLVTLQRLADDAALRQRLGRAAQAFAAAHCSEPHARAWFLGYLEQLSRPAAAGAPIRIQPLPAKETSP